MANCVAVLCSQLRPEVGFNLLEALAPEVER